MASLSQVEKDVQADYPEERIQEFLDVAQELVAQAAEKVKAALSNRDKKVMEKSSATDLVTETDKATEKLLVGGLSAKFPGHKFIGEEDVAENKSNNVGDVTDDPTWIIDPIDGTTNFVHGHPMVCISVGLVIKRVPWIGIVSVPMTNNIYHAVRFKGAYLNGEKIQTSGCRSLSKSMFLPALTCLAGDTSDEDKQMKMMIGLGNLAKIASKVQAVRLDGSAAINLVMIANGESDVYPQVGIRCWDIVAGGLIVQEAGGCLMDPRDGSDYDYMSRGILAASTPELAKAVLDLGLTYRDISRDHPDTFTG